MNIFAMTLEIAHIANAVIRKSSLPNSLVLSKLNSKFMGISAFD